MNYIGSKHTLCPILIKIISQEIPNLGELCFLDMFAGTGSVGFRFQDITNKCFANDLEYYSYIIILLVNLIIKIWLFSSFLS